MPRSALRERHPRTAPALPALAARHGGAVRRSRCLECLAAPPPPLPGLRHEESEAAAGRWLPLHRCQGHSAVLLPRRRVWRGSCGLPVRARGDAPRREFGESRGCGAGFWCLPACWGRHLVAGMKRLRQELACLLMRRGLRPLARGLRGLGPSGFSPPPLAAVSRCRGSRCTVISVVEEAFCASKILNLPFWECGCVRRLSFAWFSLKHDLANSCIRTGLQNRTKQAMR